jgi:hypothetical protein
VDNYRLLSSAAAEIDGASQAKAAEVKEFETEKEKMRRKRQIMMAKESEANSQLQIISEPYMVSALSIIVVGASGDLAKKKTFPALLDLFSHGHLPRDVNIIGVARSKMEDSELRERLKPYCMKINGVDDELCGVCMCMVTLLN